MQLTHPLYFVAQGSRDLERLEAVLTARQRRCNMMMVKTAEQASVIMRRESSGTAPDLVIIWGGATDARARALVKLMRADAALGKTSLLALADDASLEDAQKEADGAVEPLSVAEVERRLGDESFWWVVVRFGQ